MLQWIDNRTWPEMLGLAFLSFCAFTILAVLVSKELTLFGVPITAALVYVTISKYQHSTVPGSAQACHKDE